MLPSPVTITVSDSYASTTTSNWSSTSTWVGGVVPLTRSDATINHAISVDASTEYYSHTYGEFIQDINGKFK